MELRMPLLKLKRLSLMKAAGYIVPHFWRKVLRSDVKWRSKMDSFEWWAAFLDDMSVVDALKLPVAEGSELKEAISDMWTHIRLVLLDWLDFVRDYDFPELEMATLKDLYFKDNGILDMAEMETIGLKSVMTLEDSNMYLNFSFATFYYLDKMVVKIYNVMTPEERLCLKGRLQAKEEYNAEQWEKFLFQRPVSENWVLELLHACFKQGDMHKLFYCWSKLSDDQRSKRALIYLPHIGTKTSLSEMMWDILRYIPEAKLEDVFRRHKLDILTVFLEWPFDEVFLPALNLCWDYLNVKELFYLLRRIICKCGKDFSKPKYILKEFWHRCLGSEKVEILSDKARFKKFSVRHIELLLKFGDRDSYRMLLVDVWHRTNGDLGYFNRKQSKYVRNIVTKTKK